jgi:hypothetical protein
MRSRAALKVGIHVKTVVAFSTYTTLGVFPNTFFKKVGLSLKRNGFHPFKGVGS